MTDAASWRETDCWVWPGNLTGAGYGPYRRIYIRTYGPVAPGMHLDHLCCNKACVNPHHLEPVTPAENVRRGHAHRRANPRTSPRYEIRPGVETDVFDPVGTAEVAERLGVRRQTVAQWNIRKLLPPPEALVSTAPCWNWPTIERWARETGRLREEQAS